MQTGNEALIREIEALAPWHVDVQINEQLSIKSALAALGSKPEHFTHFLEVEARNIFFSFMKRIYPTPPPELTFLDCACNCGAYSFWMKELGAARCFGFDVREHWIKQAEFLLHARSADSSGISFALCDLYELGKLRMPHFKVTMFKGIFYHLPDPITGLKIAAELTEDVIIVDTLTASAGLRDNMLVQIQESVTHVMSGVYGLAWLPTGPKVIEGILAWLGFPNTHLLYWNRETAQPGRGRLCVIGARRPELLSGFANGKQNPAA